MESYKKILFYLLVLFCCGACAPQIIESESTLENNSAEDLVMKDSILFLGFDIFKGEVAESNSVKLNSKMISPGFLKKDITAVPTIPKGKIKCTLLDDAKNVIKSTLVDNPLIQSLEYGDHDHADHAGHDHEKVELGRKVVKKENAFFSFRARHDAAIKFVRIELVDAEANPANVFLIRL